MDKQVLHQLNSGEFLLLQTDRISAVEFLLTWFLGEQVRVVSTTPVYGGSINTCEKIGTTAGDFFMKWNTHEQIQSFIAEREGLQTLRETNTFIVPEIINIAQTGDTSLMVMQNIISSEPNDAFWEQFGYCLASLHRYTSDTFGFHSDNNIGSLPQKNDKHKSWQTFFIEMRLLPLLTLAEQSGTFGSTVIKRFEKLFPLLNDYFPEEAPALLHGDLWSGNFLCNHKGNPVLIDPAVYFGHREMELSFMNLFGGFPTRVFEVYQEVFPLFPDWRDRISTYNLYPLLVHCILFGKSYWNPIDQTLRSFGV